VATRLFCRPAEATPRLRRRLIGADRHSLHAAGRRSLLSKEMEQASLRKGEAFPQVGRQSRASYIVPSPRNAKAPAPSPLPVRSRGRGIPRDTRVPRCTYVLLREWNVKRSSWANWGFQRFSLRRGSKRDAHLRYERWPQAARSRRTCSNFAMAKVS
jgi:hypothetical protein